MALRPLAILVSAVALAACGDDGLGEPPGGDTTERPADREPTRRVERPRLRPARCPVTHVAANCAAARGSVIYIESVDADGDGDLHVVATRTAGDAVTGGGLVVFDVRKDLRPRRDPKPGDEVTGWGPVYEGSYGQKQISVEEFRVARR